MALATFSSTLTASPVLPARAATVAERKSTVVQAIFTKSKPSSKSGVVKPKTIGAKKAVKKVAAKKPVSKDQSGQWTLARTLSEKKLGEVGDNLGKGVQFGGFTKENETFVGRIAMLGTFGTVLVEAYTGNGALAQFDLETGLKLWETEDLLLAQISFILFLAVSGFATGGKFISDPASLSPVKPGNWREAFGLTADGPILGFFPENELFIGRLAMIGFAGTTLVEAFTGLGPLKQLGVETGLGLNIEEDVIFGTAAFFAVTAFFPSILNKIQGEKA